MREKGVLLQEIGGGDDRPRKSRPRRAYRLCGWLKTATHVLNRKEAKMSPDVIRV